MQELDHDLGELLDFSQDFAGNVQFLQAEFLEPRCEDGEGQRCVVCSKTDERARVDMCSAEVLKQEQEGSQDGNLGRQASKCAADLLLCEGRIDSLKASLSEITRWQISPFLTYVAALLQHE
jgi:hypothetical protein